MKSSCLLYKEGIGMGGGMTQTLLGGIIEVNGKFSLTLNRDLSHSQLCKENHCFSYANETFLQKVSSEGE